MTTMTSTTERVSPEQWYDFQIKDTEYLPLDENTSKLDLTLPHGAKLCDMGLILPDGDEEEEQLGRDHWFEIGKKLVEIDKGMQWALGTWWAFGRNKYGDRALIAKELKYKFGYLCNLGRVARRVPPSCRCEVLSWSHHEKVAKLDPVLQKMWLERAAEQNWTCSTLEQKIKDERNADRIEADESLKRDDPDEYRRQQSHRTATEAIFEFGKVSANSSLNFVVQAITNDPEFLADLADRVLVRLTNVARREADRFNETVAALEQEQSRRAKRKPRMRERLDERIRHRL